MSTKIRITVAVLFALTAWIPTAGSQETDKASDKLEELRKIGPEARREAFEAMSEEERTAIRESAQGRRAQQRADRESMTPDEREAAKQKRRERFESMSPEQQEEMKNRRAGRQQSGDRSSQRSQKRRGSQPSGNQPLNESKF